MKCFGSDKPFLEISRMFVDGGEDKSVVVHRSPPVLDTLSPVFEIDWITMYKLCKSEEAFPLKFTVKNYKSNGNHTDYGEVECSVEEFSQNETKFQFKSATMSILNVQQKE